MPIRQTALAIALLFTGVADAQTMPYGNPHAFWQQSQWYGQPAWGGIPYQGRPSMPLPMPRYPAPFFHWGGNVIGASSNLQDLGDYYLLQMRLPGVQPKDLNMHLDGRALSISVQAAASQGAPASGQWHGFFQNMQQSFTLPQPVDGSRMQGYFENGILTLTLPKAR
jgi:HSP20 family molecular chaperone IbpA